MNSSRNMRHLVIAVSLVLNVILILAIGRRIIDGGSEASLALSPESQGVSHHKTHTIAEESALPPADAASASARGETSIPASAQRDNSGIPLPVSMFVETFAVGSFTLIGGKATLGETVVNALQLAPSDVKRCEELIEEMVEAMRNAEPGIMTPWQEDGDTLTASLPALNPLAIEAVDQKLDDMSHLVGTFRGNVLKDLFKRHPELAYEPARTLVLRARDENMVELVTQRDKDDPVTGSANRASEVGERLGPQEYSKGWRYEKLIDYDAVARKFPHDLYWQSPEDALFSPPKR